MDATGSGTIMFSWISISAAAKTVHEKDIIIWKNPMATVSQRFCHHCDSLCHIDLLGVSLYRFTAAIQLEWGDLTWQWDAHWTTHFFPATWPGRVGLQDCNFEWSVTILGGSSSILEHIQKALNHLGKLSSHQTSWKFREHLRKYMENPHLKLRICSAEWHKTSSVTLTTKEVYHLSHIDSSLVGNIRGLNS